MSKITFIGGGNMATAIIGGLIASGKAPADITVVEPNDDQCAQLEAQHGVHTTQNSQYGCETAEVIVLAVKPQVISSVAKDFDAEGKLLISIAAGVTIASLQKLFGDIAIARAMPNTPALLGLGASGLYLNDKATQAQAKTAREIIEAFGICVPVQREDLLDAVTAVSGSGPAYYFLLIEKMIKAGTSLGLSPQDAATLTVQTALGAASMAAKGDVDPAELRRRVTSPNGTTHAAIVSFEAQGFGKIVETAMTACRDRAIELGKD